MSAPREAKARTVARPTPADAPVTTTTDRRDLEDKLTTNVSLRELLCAVFRAQPRQGERPQRQSEIAQRDVEVSGDRQQVEDDAAQPEADHPAADARHHGDEDAGEHFDDARAAHEREAVDRETPAEHRGTVHVP